ncbi:MAG: M48 family metallopeptidase [Myxococcales bacterium]|nr:M48 family metallopeptidase [Myxococcales bacterium]
MTTPPPSQADTAEAGDSGASEPHGLSLTQLRKAIWPEGRRVPRRKVRCRHCGQRNRVQVPEAALSPERHRCGSCDGALFLDRDEPLTRIASEAYEHSLDRRSLSALKSIPGASAIIRYLLERISDRSARLFYMSDAVRCDEDQFPELLQLVNRARARLDIDLQPTLFVGESPHMNALTSGVSEPVIVVRSALIDSMDDDELLAVLGHELGHLHAGHPLYQTVAQALLQGAASASVMVRVLSLPIHRALLVWVRCAELTADRAALLASRDLAACLGTMITFAGGKRRHKGGRGELKLAPFIRQCRELAALQSQSSVDALLGGYLSMDRTHPHLAWRVMHLIHWVEHGNYLDILAGDYRRRQALTLLSAGAKKAIAALPTTNRAEALPAASEAEALPEPATEAPIASEAQGEDAETPRQEASDD